MCQRSTMFSFTSIEWKCQHHCSISAIIYFCAFSDFLLHHFTHSCTQHTLCSSDTYFILRPFFVFRIKFSHILSMHKSPFQVFGGCSSNAIPKLYYIVFDVACLTLRLWHFCRCMRKECAYFFLIKLYV